MTKVIGLDISVLNERQRTGIGVYTDNLIKALLTENKKDKFILFGIATLATFKYLKNIEFKNYPNVELQIYKMPAKFFRISFLLWQKLNWPAIEKFIGPVDIFHSFNWYLPPQRESKVVATVFDMTPLLYPQFHLKKTIQLDKIRLNRIKDRADLVITISENSKKDFLKFSPQSWVEVAYPAVSDIFLKKIDKEKSKKVLKKYNLEPGYILSVGTLEPRKNIEGVMKAFVKLASQGSTLCAYGLVILGAKGWMNEEICKLPKKLGIEDNVRFIGRVEDEDLPALYSNAFCLVYPSFYEGFGIPILEAQASGCPVITSAVSSLPEAGGQGAIYVDPYSVEDIIRGMREIGRIREKLVKEGFSNLKRFSWEESARKLNLLYQRL
ncbi:glycosyltransferase family 4 protein [Candidatus Daviesbacteria bacterium]|nr:glycosyltransferase family 4 protein [Candidatus Daviesbacteria bacterium]